jgi:hypothetical protein
MKVCVIGLSIGEISSISASAFCRSEVHRRSAFDSCLVVYPFPNNCSACPIDFFSSSRPDCEPGIRISVILGFTAHTFILLFEIDDLIIIVILTAELPRSDSSNSFRSWTSFKKLEYRELVQNYPRSMILV